MKQVITKKVVSHTNTYMISFLTDDVKSVALTGHFEFNDEELDQYFNSRDFSVESMQQVFTLNGTNLVHFNHVIFATQDEDQFVIIGEMIRELNNNDNSLVSFYVDQVSLDGKFIDIKDFRKLYSIEGILETAFHIE